jgi:hypothetical protein
LLRVESEHPEMPVNFGVPGSPTVMFERGPAFETLPGFKGAVLARYPKQDDPLESGMTIHSDVLHGQIAALELSYGRGRIFLYGFKPQQRAQAHGTYRYFFNTLYQFEDPPMPVEAPGSAPKSGDGTGSNRAADAESGDAERSARGASGATANGETGGGRRRSGTGSALQP